MDLIQRTTVEEKKPGDIITAADINSMNNTINTLVAVVNGFFFFFTDANLEVGISKRVFTLAEAIAQVPMSRRSIGMKIKFYNHAENYSEYFYKGNSIDDTAWYNEDNWAASNIGAVTESDSDDGNINNIVDGGEWVWTNDQAIRRDTTD